MKWTAFRIVSLAVACCAVALPAAAQSSNDGATADYIVRLQPMNTAVTDTKATGEARLSIDSGKLTITVTAEGLPPGIMHLQHFHGFKTDRVAHCPTHAADTNGDGIVDLIETNATSGTTMVPFTADPASMKIVTDTYPTASDQGTYTYRQTVPLEKLQQAFANAFEGQNLDFDRRVVYIHGVLPDAGLADSVASLGDIPAHVTLPIACGEIEPVAN